MDAIFTDPTVTADQNRRISAVVARESARLRSFIRRRVQDAADVDDILQETLYELVAAHRVMQPIEQMGAWLMRVARNRIIDRFRRRRVAGLSTEAPSDTDEAVAALSLEELLPATGPGPEGAALRQMLLEQVEEALDELPGEQREAFIAHELEGVSFKELAARSGVGVNTLLARKRYAVLALRARLQQTYDDWFDET